MSNCLLYNISRKQFLLPPKQRQTYKKILLFWKLVYRVSCFSSLSLSLELSLCNFTSSPVTSGSDHCRSHQSWEEVRAPLSTTDPGTSCSNPPGDEIKLLGGWWQSRPRVKSWYPLKIISKVCGGGATPKRRRFSGVPVFLHLHISFPLRMKNHFHIHIIFLQGHLASSWHSIVR